MLAVIVGELIGARMDGFESYEGDSLMLERVFGPYHHQISAIIAVLSIRRSEWEGGRISDPAIE
jgi:hypothetical protein